MVTSTVTAVAHPCPTLTPHAVEEINPLLTTITGWVGAVWPRQEQPPPGEDDRLPVLPTVVPKPLPGRLGDSAEYVGGMFMTAAGLGVPILFFAGLATMTAGRVFGNRVAGAVGGGMVIGSIVCAVLWASGQGLIGLFANGDLS